MSASKRSHAFSLSSYGIDQIPPWFRLSTYAAGSTRDVQNRVGGVPRTLQQLDRFLRPHRGDLDAAALCLLEDCGHHRQRTLRPGADDQPGALPGDLLLDRERRVAELVAKAFRGLLLAQPDCAAIDHDVTVEGPAIVADGPERHCCHADDATLTRH